LDAETIYIIVNKLFEKSVLSTHSLQSFESLWFEIWYNEESDLRICCSHCFCIEPSKHFIGSIMLYNMPPSKEYE